MTQFQVIINNRTPANIHLDMRVIIKSLFGKFLIISQLQNMLICIYFFLTDIDHHVQHKLMISIEFFTTTEPFKQLDIAYRTVLKDK